MIYNILTNKQLPIYGKGKNSREWKYDKDNTEALIKIYENEKHSHGAQNPITLEV